MVEDGLEKKNDKERSTGFYVGLAAGSLPMIMGACASFLPWVILSAGPIHTGSAPGLSGFERGWGWVSFAAAVLALLCFLAGMYVNGTWFIVGALILNSVVTGVLIYNLRFAGGEYYGSAPWGLLVGMFGG
ncbi:MAG: hypothetical protein JW738_09750, partial [Actinobacteria bacterium]|nr:hypothetical protein [Actinomycetota bacterium]